ncbi:hypothetical protein PVAP13_8KG343600 [Panicum virgatum]|uniref:Uncharacterized protein n=1 Tax=Panicum virgatum TaxID=38727 RepID=A0A8T0PYD1_PANVG|nr:hypothetical protein PVAP13_8KG343600 [Panicum virgatum]
MQVMRRLHILKEPDQPRTNFRHSMSSYPSLLVHNFMCPSNLLAMERQQR